eukprot:1973300-Prymnesium_polylepis.3
MPGALPCSRATLGVACGARCGECPADPTNAGVGAKTSASMGAGGDYKQPAGRAGGLGFSSALKASQPRSTFSEPPSLVGARVIALK